MRGSFLALLAIAALAPWDQAVSAQEAGAATGPAVATEAPKARSIDPIVPPVRRVAPVTPPPSKEIKGVVAAPKGKAAGHAPPCKPRKGLKASCATAATAPASKAKPEARNAGKPAKDGSRTAASKAGRTASSGR